MCVDIFPKDRDNLRNLLSLLFLLLFGNLHYGCFFLLKDPFGEHFPIVSVIRKGSKKDPFKTEGPV